ncbi:VanZ family protein [Diplocloster hominis]|uniref:VanZ family protein n=1 Tax=Diplocloster hominis TaxID=3079010 RepID=UPI0031BBA5E0
MKKKRSSLHNFVLYSVFLFYIFVLCVLLFRTIHPARSLNLVPFRSIINYLSGRDQIMHTFALSNVLGNIVLFIPLGIYLTLFHRDKRIFKNLLWIVIISLTVEIIQYTFRLGIGDIDDIILNSLGGFLGIAAYRMLLLIFKDTGKVRRIIEIIAPIGGIASFLILFLYNTL